MGFAVDECFAWTYVPEPEHYPFTVTTASMIVGGDDMTSEDFYIGVWSVLPTGEPDAELASGTVNINGENAMPDVVPLDAIGATVEDPAMQQPLKGIAFKVASVCVFVTMASLGCSPTSQVFSCKAFQQHGERRPTIAGTARPAGTGSPPG